MCVPWAPLLLVVAILALGGAIVAYVLAQPPADDPGASPSTTQTAAPDLGPAALLRRQRRLDHVLENGKVREQVEVLEHESDLRTLPQNLFGFELV